MYAIQSSLSVFPLVFFTRSVMDPAPQNSITSCGQKHTQRLTRWAGTTWAPTRPGVGPPFASWRSRHMFILEAFKLLRACHHPSSNCAHLEQATEAADPPAPSHVLTGSFSPTHAGLEDHFVLNQRPIIRKLVQIVPNSVSHVPKSDYSQTILHWLGLEQKRNAIF